MDQDMDRDLEQLKYPIGRLVLPEDITDRHRQQWIEELAVAPAAVRQAVAGLDEGQLDTPYRPGGWTTRQLVHHLADTHVHAYVNFKKGLLEDEPNVTTYNPDAWAGTPEARTGPVAPSLTLMEGLHGHWVNLLRALKPEDFSRTVRHPRRGAIPLEWTLGLYAWHGRHHTAHITELRRRMGW